MKKIFAGKKKSFIWGMVFILVIFFLTGTNAFASAGAHAARDSVRIIVKDSGVVRGKRIFLSDIALLENCDMDLEKRIGSIKLGRSPGLGRKKTLSGRSITAALNSRKFIPEDAEIEVPDAVEINRACQRVSRDDLKEMFYGYVSDLSGGEDFRVSGFRFHGRQIFPEGELDFELLRNGKGSMGGRVMVSAIAYVDGVEAGKINLTGTVHRSQKVVCVKKSMKRGDKIRRGDLSFKTVEGISGSDRFLTDMHDAVGMCLKQGVRDGGLLRPNMLKMPYAVNRGDRVRLVARRGALKVVALGIARNNAVIDGQVQVQNIRSKKMVTGRVVNSSTVEVFF